MKTPLRSVTEMWYCNPLTASLHAIGTVTASSGEERLEPVHLEQAGREGY
jgi:hypothetical protein